MQAAPYLSLAIWVPIVAGMLVLAAGDDRRAELQRQAFARRARAYAGGLQHQLKVGAVVAASGRLSFRSEGPHAAAELIVDDIQPLEAAVARYARQLRLDCDPSALPDEKLEELREALDSSPGACRVVFAHETAEGISFLELDARVNVTQNLLESIDKILGPRSWQIKSES